MTYSLEAAGLILQIRSSYTRYKVNRLGLQLTEQNVKYIKLSVKG